jgi:glutathione synthase/RimK-type ligase-like ATP-grasp enzyme
MTRARVTCSASLELRLRTAEALGWRASCLDPETGWLWRIERGDRSMILAGPTSSLNDAAAARLAADKFFTATVLRAAGLRVPDTVRCLRSNAHASTTDDGFASQRGLEPALAFADARGYPLIVKPNRGARGLCVSRVDERPALLRAIERVWATDEIALVQPALPGLDLRVDLLDGELLLAYLRRPLRLRGDGRSTVLELLAAVDGRAINERFLTKLRAEPLWGQTLAAAGLDEGSVIAIGVELVFPATVLNLNRCCTAEVFDALPERWLTLCRRIARALRLRHCGVDLRVSAIADPIASDPAEATVLEVNSSPSMMQIHELGAGALADAAERRVLEAMLEHDARSK